MKKILSMTLLASLLSFAAIADDNAVVLNAPAMDLGALSQPTNASVNQTLRFKRTAETPKEVTVKYKMNYVRTECTEYELKYTDVPEIKKTVCTSNLDGTHQCAEAAFEGFQVPERVCVGNGLSLKTTEKTFKLNFKKAITLTPNAVEVFEVLVDQKGMDKTETAMKASAVDTASVYVIKVKKDSVTFKAK